MIVQQQRMILARAGLSRPLNSTNPSMLNGNTAHGTYERPQHRSAAAGHEVLG